MSQLWIRKIQSTYPPEWRITTGSTHWSTSVCWRSGVINLSSSPIIWRVGVVILCVQIFCVAIWWWGLKPAAMIANLKLGCSNSGPKRVGAKVRSSRHKVITAARQAPWEKPNTPSKGP